MTLLRTPDVVHDEAAPGVAGPTGPEAVAAARFRARYGGVELPPVVIVIPAYEEEQTVASVVASVPTRIHGHAVGVLVVDDGSRDATSPRADKAGALVARLPERRGQGVALRLGYGLARSGGARFIATLDADGQWPAADLPAVLGPVIAGTADLVSGSRMLGSDCDGSRTRQAGVVVFASLIRALTGAPVTDPANGMKAMTVEVAGAVELRQQQFQSSELILSAVCRGFRYAEVPVGHLPRSAGSSKKGGNLSYGLRFGSVVVRTWARERGWRRRRRGPVIASPGALGRSASGT